MSADLKEPFNPSCCEGVGAETYSAQPCGCDPGAKWTCERHRPTEARTALPQPYRPYNRPAAPQNIVTDAVTGGKKETKLARFDLIPPEFEWALAEHYGIGCKKYADRNWELGYKWSLSYAALRRHLSAWASGEQLDAETGSHHLVAVAWHAIALYVFDRRGLGTNDLQTIREK